MKCYTILRSLVFVFLLGIAFLACNNEGITPDGSNPNRIVNSFSTADTLNCENQISHEYDILALVYNMEWSNASKAVLALVGTSLYQTIETQLESAASIGLSSWLNSYAGNNLSSDLKNELIDLEDFIEENAGNENYNTLIDQLIDQFLDDNRFDIDEKNILVSCAETSKAAWEFERCIESEFATRGYDDEAICGPAAAITTTTSCGRETLAKGIIVGGVVGWIAGGPIGGLGGAITGLILSGVFNIFGCPEVSCDDCHHPKEIVLILDYLDCQYAGAEAFGAFEFAENWEWNISVASGNFFRLTDFPRVAFPETFDPNHTSFSIRCLTLCDGQTHPDDDDFGTLEIFSSYFPPIPWMILGNVVVDDNSNFRFESSATFDNLSSPDWSASTNVDLIDSGFENGVFFAIFNFSNVTNSTAQINLTLHDDCAGGNHNRIKTVQIVQI